MVAGCSSAGGPTSTTTPTQTLTESDTPTESGTPSGPSLSPSATLGEAIPGERTFFGGSVALSSDGSTALVGARDDERDGEATGAAYVFGRADGGWERRDTLLAGDAAAGDWFGRAVALSGDGSVALVGAPLKRTTGGAEAGVGYAFAVDDGEWRQTARITPGDGDDIDHFAENLALADDGETAILAAPGDDSEALGAVGSKGSAYVFDGDWTEQTKITFTEPEDSPRLGSAVSLSADGSVALIGAENDDGRLGSAFVFERGADGWSRTTKLSLDGPEKDDSFGDAVALSGDATTALVGASYRDTDRGQNAGSVTFFEETDDGWERTTTRSPDHTREDDHFGEAVSLSSDGTAAVVGIGDEYARGPYGYIRDEDGWTRRSELDPGPGELTEYLGLGVDIDAGGTTALVGAPGSDASYVFSR